MPIMLAPPIDAAIPDGITSLEAFRDWAQSDDFPRLGNYSYYHDTLWVDANMEYGISHNQVKGAINAQLTMMVDQIDLGVYFTDGMVLTNLEVGLSTLPDGVYVSHERFKSGQVLRIGKDTPDYSELVGTPDMTLEVVSRSSQKKDVVDFPNLYFEAGITEYWLVDARRDPLKFDLFRRGANGYEPTPADADGFSHSQVFNRSFRLVRGVNRSGDPKFTLEVR